MSVSRVGGKAQLAAYRAVAGDLKLAYAQFEELESFDRFGARLDDATRITIGHGRRIRACLRQPEFSPVSVPAQITVLLALAAGLFDRVPLDQMRTCRTGPARDRRRTPDAAARMSGQRPETQRPGLCSNHRDCRTGTQGFSTGARAGCDRGRKAVSDTGARLRRKIGSAGDLRSVVRTMKAVAAASIAQYERSVAALADYRLAVELGLGVSLRQLVAAREPIGMWAATGSGGVGAIVFGSDQGLVGQFNDAIADRAVKALATLPGPARVWAFRSSRRRSSSRACAACSIRPASRGYSPARP